MSESSIVDDDPFAAEPPDEVAERDSLVRAIELSQGFTLLLACCNRADHRDRLMAEIVAQLPGLRVQWLPLREPIRNLLIELRTCLESPPPDALFVYGVEGWLPAGVDAQNDPFIRNLNAARNHFPREVRCPLVFWLPQHILTTLARGAADFCSVRSGIYSFCATPEVRDRTARSLTSDDMTGMAGLPYGEKFERAEALAAMLAEYEALPPELRDPLAESRLLDSMATLQYVLGHFKAAEPLLQRALATREASLGADHPEVAEMRDKMTELFDLSTRYAEANPLFYFQVLSATRKAPLGVDHPITAAILKKLALLYDSQGRYAEAEPLYRRVLANHEAFLRADHPDTAMSLNNLASLYDSQGRYAEAEPLYRRALAIKEKSLGADHPSTAMSLNNLAWLYDSQGRYAEAEPLYRRALAIKEKSLGPDHPSTALSLENYAALLRQLGREDEANSLTARAHASREAHARINAKASDEATSE